MSKLNLVDHQISLVYFLADEAALSEQERLVSELNGEDLFPALPELKENFGSQAIWIGKREGKADQHPQSIDLTQPARDLLYGNRRGLLSRRKLNPALQHHLRYGDLPSASELGLTKKMIALELGQRASERLKAQGIVPVPLWIEPTHVELLSFGTGATAVLVNVALARIANNAAEELSLLELQEAVHALSRFNRCAWYDRDSNQRIEKGTFSFGTLVQKLIHHEAPSATAFTRVPTYTFAQLKDQVSPDQLEREAGYLARRYTSDYPFSSEHAGLSFVGDFDDNRHAVSLEGVATVQCPTTQPQTEFWRNWKSGPLMAAYLPIYLFLLHENWFLSDRRMKTVQPEEQSALLEELERIVDDTMVFDLYYRFPAISQISMQQSFADAIRAELRLESNFSALEATAGRVAERLQSEFAALDAEEARKEAELAEMRDARFNRIARLGTAALSGLTAYTILKDLFQLVADTWSIDWLKSLPVVERLIAQATIPFSELAAGWGALIVSALVSVLVYQIARRSPPDPKANKRATKVLLLNRIARLLRK